MLNFLLILVFLGVLASLGASSFFLTVDPPSSRRLVLALYLRVALSFLLLILILYGLTSGSFSISLPFPR